MTLDILIAFPVLLTIAFGFRDGLVRKAVTLFFMIIALFLGQIYMHDAGIFLARFNIASPEAAPRKGFYCIFFGILFVQSILYRMITGNYKIGGFMDRFAGAALGFVQGIVFMSVMLMMMSLSGFPDRDMIKYSQFYKMVVNVAPEILDVTSSIRSEASDQIKKIAPDDENEKTPADSIKPRGAE
jgi:uncharacterized membrane protein required for colicin V production